jgi:hypothetical protein
MTKITLGAQMEKELRAWQRAETKDMQIAATADATSTPLPTVAGWCKVGEFVNKD